MSNTVSAELFQNLIKMVSGNYTIHSEEKFQIFNEGVQQFTQYIFLQDALIDGDVNWVEDYQREERILININILYRFAVQNLTKVFGHNHPFWNYLSEQEIQYYDYIGKEKYISFHKSNVDISDFEEMAFAKHCLALVPLKGMEWLSTSRIEYLKIKELFIPIFQGIQMMDDIDDFSKDLKSGQWNLIQYEVQNTIKSEGLFDDGSLDKFEERVFYASGICKKYSEYVLDRYQKASTVSNELGFSIMSIWLDKMILEIIESINFVDQMMED